MPRVRRLDHPGARHHVMNRFADRKRRFDEPGARALFLDVVATASEQFGLHIHGYALMSNHYHLMVEVPRGNLSRAMQNVGSTFTQRFHRRYGGDGPVFRGRFRNEVVDTDSYWMQLLIYLHLNPVRGKIVSNPSSSRWTSHRAYTGADPSPHWLVTDQLLRLFGSGESIHSHATAAAKCGGASSDAIEVPAPSTALRPSIATLDAAQALSQIVAVLAVRPQRAPAGPIPATGRRLTAWWLWRSTDMTLVEIGDLLGVSRTRARQLVVAFQDQAASNAEAAACMHQLLFSTERAPTAR